MPLAETTPDNPNPALIVNDSDVPIFLIALNDPR